MTRRDPFGTRRMWLPAAGYLAAFFLLNPHLASRFSTEFYFGGQDGFQNIWNLWWVDRSLRSGHLWLWHTDLLHYPWGTSLIGHTLTPFNGLVAAALLPVLSMVQTYNSLVVFSFVAGGLTMFWLSRHVTRSDAGSLVAGAVFTFSSFHFMHADGHLQLVALEWLPLFVLAWMRFCDAPTVRGGIGAALALLLVLLCDVYYFAYAVMAGAFYAAWVARHRRDILFLCRSATWRATLGFLVPAALTSGVFVARLVQEHAADPLLGTHSPKALSMDLLSPFVWGYFWRFRDGVAPLWRPLSQYVFEASVYVGLSVWMLAFIAWRKRRSQPLPSMPFWGWLILFFGVMSLGPNLHVAGVEVRGPTGTFWGHKQVNFLVLPYAVLWLLLPPWRLAGVPLRMMVMVQLAAAVMAAAGVRALLASTTRWKWAAVAACLAWLVGDFLPMPMQTTPAERPAYVDALARLPDGAVLDLASPAPQALWYQTLHQKPMAFGYISRTPTSVDRADQALAALILRGDWARVARDYRFRYLVTSDRPIYVMVRGLDGQPLPPITGATPIYRAGGTTIYAFGRGPDDAGLPR